MVLDVSRHVLITGGSGFLGGYIIRALHERNPQWRVTLIDLVEPDEAFLEQENTVYYQADITSSVSLHSTFQIASINGKIDVVIHAAGIIPARTHRYSTDKKQWNKVYNTNVEGTKNVVAAAQSVGCERLIYTSSCTAVVDDLEHDYFHWSEDVPTGQATLHYGRAKVLAEQHVLNSTRGDHGAWLACVIRPSIIIGAGDIAVVSVMHDLIAKGETSFIVGDGYNIGDFMCVENAALAHVLAAENLLSSDDPTAAGEIFNVSNGEPVYFWDFLAAVWAEFGHVPPRRIRIPRSIAWAAGACLEWVTWCTGGASTLDRGSVKDATSTRYADISKARRVLGYAPVLGLTAGVKNMCKAYKAHLEKVKG